MSYIGHPCPCGHMDIHHERHLRGAACGRGCRGQCGDYGPPELRATFQPNGTPIEKIAEPGTRRNVGAFGGSFEVCDCVACWVLYRELTGDLS